MFIFNCPSLVQKMEEKTLFTLASLIWRDQQIWTKKIFPKNGKIFAIMATLFRCGVARHVLAAAHAANQADRRSRLRPVPQHRLHLNHDQPAGPRRDRIRLNEDRERADAPETGKTKSGSIPNDLDVEDEWNWKNVFFFFLEKKIRRRFSSFRLLGSLGFAAIFLPPKSIDV